MDKRLKYIYDNLDKMKLGLDDTFKFNCTMCGKCCINRDDILLTPKDLFGLATALDLKIEDFILQYCEIYIGQSSKIPIVRLRPVGPTKRCPLLKGNRCSVHSFKPVVCALFPLGRCISFDNDKLRGGDFNEKDIQYFFQNPGCGDNRKEHTVREWLKDFDLSTEDKFFIKWQQIVAYLSQFVNEYESRLSEKILDDLENVFLVVLYLDYKQSDDFYTQFVQNTDTLVEKLEALKKELK